MLNSDSTTLCRPAEPNNGRHDCTSTSFEQAVRLMPFRRFTNERLVVDVERNTPEPLSFKFGAVHALTNSLGNQ